MPPKLVTKWQAVTNSLEMYETCSSRSQMEGRWNAIVPRDDNHELKNGAEGSSRKRQSTQRPVPSRGDLTLVMLFPVALVVL